MNILLLQSFLGTDDKKMEKMIIYPLGLVYIGSQLPRDYKVDILDLNTLEHPYDEVKKYIKKNIPKVVGISFRNIKLADPSGKYLSCLKTLDKLVKFIRSINNEIIIILGGTAFSLYAFEIMREIKEINFGIFGEGEESFPELLVNLDQPEKVKGVYFWKEGELFFTGQRNWLPFDKSAGPRRDLLDIRRYNINPYSIGIQTKRGCILECIHCCDRYLLGNNVRLRSSKNVVNEIEDLVINHKAKSFIFVDQIFNIPLNHANEICQEIIKRKLSVKWTAWFNEKFITEDFLVTAREAGCNLVNFSPDSVSDVILKRFKKNILHQDIINAVNIVKKANIPVAFSFMINGPGENLRTIIKNITFFIKTKFFLKQNLRIHTDFIIPMRIYPHTELREIAIKNGIIAKEDDLISPKFYNPPPLRYMVLLITTTVKILWWGKHIVKTLMSKKQVVNCNL